MPLEGHYQRVNTPLRKLTKRERMVVIWGTLATAIAILALVVATAGDSRPAPGPGCFSATVAGRTGGEPVNACGTEAAQVCRRAAEEKSRWAEAVLSACLDAKIRF
jgi:hypothetical protein